LFRIGSSAAEDSELIKIGRLFYTERVLSLKSIPQSSERVDAPQGPQREDREAFLRSFLEKVYAKELSLLAELAG
jgi:hypothetical protein